MKMPLEKKIKGSLPKTNAGRSTKSRMKMAKANKSSMNKTSGLVINSPQGY